MGASAFAQLNDVNDYPKEVSDIVDKLIHLQIINEGGTRYKCQIKRLDY